MAKAKRSGLGKGLDALFIDNNTEDGQIATLRLSEMEPNKSQPRTHFDEEALRELADSIREHGIIQALVVRPMEKGPYQIVAGERRWRAARMAGLTEVPVVIRQLGDEQTLEIAIIENLQREDLNAIELALGCQNLMENYGMTQEKVAEKLGKSRPAVANIVRLLQLPQSVQDGVRSGKISKGHAKALLSLEDEELIEEVAARLFADDSILVREIETMARERKKNGAAPPPKTGKAGKEDEQLSLWGGDNFHKEVELALAEALGRKVRVTSKGNKTTLELEFYDDLELAEFANKISK